VVKRSLYEEGQRLFLKAGYEDIGMDHFSLESDSLAKAHREGRLHRNFMGYTTNQTDLLLGLGVSSISDAKYAYSQNVKKVEDYYARIASTGSAVFKGHIQTEEDRKLREAILDIVCRGRIDLNHLTIALDAKSGIALQQMQNEGILIIEDGLLQVTTSGRAFIRNIAAIFDKRMQMVRDREAPIFSKAI
jgi:oxygen-independent coproporphyrinogen III oxidase